MAAFVTGTDKCLNSLSDNLTSSVNEIPIVRLTDATPFNEDDRAAIAQKSREVMNYSTSPMW